MPEPISAAPDHRSGSLSTSALVAAALTRATDVTPDAWVVYGIERAVDGDVADLRLLYGNAAFWQLSGFDGGSIGRSISELAPGIDWQVGLAARLIDAARTGGTVIDRHVRILLQLGPLAGLERVFEIEVTAHDGALAAGFRDVTDDLAADERRDAEARRSAAVARFLATAVDPAVTRDRLLAALADELATTIGDLVLVTEAGDEGGFRVLAAAGGPGGVAAQIRASHLGRSVTATRWSGASLDGAAIIERPTVHLAVLTDELREALATSFQALGLPPELARSMSSHVSAPIQGSAGPIGRVVVDRFGDDRPYSADDVKTVETIAAAAALVLERRAAETRLARSLARFEALFEQAPMPMVALGGDRPSEFNTAALNLFGRSREEMLSHAFAPDAPWIPSDQAQAWAALRDRAAAGQWSGTSRVALVRPDGQRRHVAFSGIPLVVDGATDGVITVLNDLTERELLEAQLRHAQKMEALGRLAGGIAHDFNNVLMAILGFGEFLAADARLGRIDVADADQIVAATRRAIELTARLTTFARRDAAVLERSDVASVIAGMLPLIERLIPESIEVVTALESGPDVVLDRVEFEQILVNLVVNAVDAMPAGGRLTIETHADVADPADATDAEPQGATGLGRRAFLVAVSDNGIGMDDETRSRIFEPFFTTKAVGAGTGLGLATVYGAVERIGGRIWVYSEPGRGTTFRIYLPPADQRDELGRVAPAVAADLRGGTEAILLLEDDHLVRTVVARTLRALGYDVVEATRPSEAFAIADARPFDALVTDVVMPELSGDAVANRLRATRPDLPVVFMSGYTARVLDFTLGPRDAMIHKPIAPSELGAVLRGALDRDADADA